VLEADQQVCKQISDNILPLPSLIFLHSTIRIFWF